jgi:hypothetical protein
MTKTSKHESSCTHFRRTSTIGAALVAVISALILSGCASGSFGHHPSAKPRADVEGVEGAAISVANLDRSIDWYRRILGLQEARRIDVPQQSMRIAFLQGDGIALELIETVSSIHRPAMNRPGIAGGPNS